VAKTTFTINKSTKGKETPVFINFCQSRMDTS